MRALTPRAPVHAAIGVAILSLAMTAVPVRAQDLPLAQVLPDLILREIVLQSPTARLSQLAFFSPIEVNDLNNPVVGIV